MTPLKIKRGISMKEEGRRDYLLRHPLQRGT